MRRSNSISKVLALVVSSLAMTGVHAQVATLHESWTDPSTGLMWAGKDNGDDVGWKGALKYCSKLRLAGYTDWRMPNMDEVQGIYDKNAKSPGLMGAKYYHNISPSTWHVKGNLYLSGEEWTTLRPLDDRGKVSSYAYYFDFNEGKSNDDPIGWPYPYVGMRVLCVRGPQAFPPAWEHRRK
jgi:hypothetical protein